MEVENVKLDVLKSHPQNPRIGNISAIMESIEQNGWWGTIVAQKSTNYVLAGNHRLMAAEALDMETVPVFWVDCDDEHAIKILLSDNKTSDLGDYDKQLLLDLVGNFSDGLSATGYTDRDLEELRLSLGDPIAPDDFPSFDETLETNSQCPKCGYEF